MRTIYFDKNGQPLDRDTFAALFENMKYRRIAQDPLPGGGRLSTVWMGLDHGSDEQGRPLIFETMAFGPDDDELDVRRSATEEQARVGHAEMLAKFGKAAGT